ncbi:MAG TPA: secondary thiamine-phosphate synthase enzyme YjbQ [Chloroflexota bacterium]
MKNLATFHGREASHPAEARSITCLARTLRLRAARAPEFLDLTDAVEELVAQSGVQSGQVLVYSKHTTAAIVINEHEPELLKDLERLLAHLVPPDRPYFHNDFSVRTVNMTDDESPNAHSHCQHLLLRTSETIPILEGQLQLGRWQRVFLVELDRPRPREVVVQVLGC